MNTIKKSKLPAVTFIEFMAVCLYVIILPINGQALSGTVVDGNNRGIKGANIRLLVLDTGCVSDANGRFSFGNVAVHHPHAIQLVSSDDVSSATEVFTLNGRMLSEVPLGIGTRKVKLTGKRTKQPFAAQLLVGSPRKKIRKTGERARVFQTAGIDTLLVTHDSYLFRKLVITDVNDSIGPVLLKDDGDDIAAYWEMLNGYYLRQDELPFDPFGYPSVDSLFTSLGDPYTEYYTKEMGQMLMDALNQNTVGLGVRIDSSDNGYRIIEVFPGTPAETAGLQEGDIFVKVDSRETTGLPFSEFYTLLQGDIGESVQLAMNRDGAILDITIVREKYHVPSVFTDSLDESTLLITITGFSLTGDFLIGGGTSDELGVALLENEWAGNVILDLRSNGGGYLFLGVECASWFMEPGIELLHMQGREFSERTGEFFTLDTVFRSIRMRNTFQKNCVILADSLTASTSEAFITMMKEKFPELPLVGTATYGKGVGQVILTGPDSGLAKITSVQLEAMSEVTWNGVGIEPDVTVEAGEDAIEVALGLLNGTLSKRRERKFRVPVTERRRIVDFCVVDRR